MKAQYKASFTVYDKPDVMFLAVNLNHSFISMPLVRIKVHHRNQLQGNTVKDRSKFLAPISNGNMRKFDVVELIEQKGDVSCRAFADEELKKDSNNQKRRMSHSFEVSFTKQLGYRRRQSSRWFWNKERMITAFITATVVGIVTVIVMKKRGFSADRTGRIFFQSCFRLKIRGKLMSTIKATIFLVSEFILAKLMKVLIIVAFRAFYRYNFLHEASSFQLGVFLAETLYHC